jgi:hypothetical protein
VWETKFHTHTKQVKLHFCTFQCLSSRRGDGKRRFSEVNGKKHSLNLICS